MFYQAGGYSLTDSAEVQYTLLYTCTLAPSGVQRRNWLDEALLLISFHIEMECTCSRLFKQGK